MDEREELIPGREQKSPKIELSVSNLDDCLCPNCPTYNSDVCPSENGEKVYCSIGKTDCELEQLGCLCGDCEVFKNNDLKTGYFCVNGEAAESGDPVAEEDTE